MHYVHLPAGRLVYKYKEKIDEQIFFILKGKVKICPKKNAIDIE